MKSILTILKHPSSLLGCYLEYYLCDDDNVVRFNLCNADRHRSHIAGYYLFDIAVNGIRRHVDIGYKNHGIDMNMDLDNMHRLIIVGVDDDDLF